MTRILPAASLVLTASAASLPLACVPELEDDLSLVRAPRLLAVRAEPAEAKPGGLITFSALVADPAGGEHPIDWSLCLDRKPLTELGPVSPACLQRAANPEVASPLGRGLEIRATLPGDGCRRFGPIRPEPQGDEPSGRPVDPDITGGYYQPVVAFLSENAEASIGTARLVCDLPAVSQAQLVEFNRRYRANANPELARLEAVRGDARESLAPAEDGAAPVRVAPGEQLLLRAEWASCPAEAQTVCGDGLCGPREDAASCAEDCAEPRGCTGAESYVVFNTLSRTVDAQRESIRLSWFASAGRFAEERTGRDAAEAAQTWSENRWTAPPTVGPVRLWLVIRDARGGVGWRSFVVDVAE